MLAASGTIPSSAITTAQTIGARPAPDPSSCSINSSGRKTNMYGSVKPTSAKRNAAMPVSMMSDPAIEAAV